MNPTLIKIIGPAIAAVVSDLMGYALAVSQRKARIDQLKSQGASADEIARAESVVVVFDYRLFVARFASGLGIGFCMAFGIPVTQ